MYKWENCQIGRLELKPPLRRNSCYEDYLKELISCLHSYVPEEYLSRLFFDYPAYYTVMHNHDMDPRLLNELKTDLRGNTVLLPNQLVSVTRKFTGSGVKKDTLTAKFNYGWTLEIKIKPVRKPSLEQLYTYEVVLRDLPDGAVWEPIELRNLS